MQSEVISILLHLITLYSIWKQEALAKSIKGDACTWDGAETHEQQYHLLPVNTSPTALINEVMSCFTNTSPGKIPEAAHQGKSKLAVVNILGKPPSRINGISITAIVSATEPTSIWS